MSLVLESLKLGASARIRLGLGARDLDPEALLQRAALAEGSQHPLDQGTLEGLHELCRSAREEADLSPMGRLAMSRTVLGALRTRHRLERHRQEHPEVFEAPLNKPIIVVGLSRTGTTWLHRLLTTSPGARPLATWEVRQPLAPRGLDLRRQGARAMVGMVRAVSPEVDAKHRLHADEPEECVFLMDASLRSPSFWMLAPVFGYLHWLEHQDMAPAYAVYRAMLQVFQAEAPQRRLVLKAPAHTIWLPQLLEAVPEATLIVTHRDPVPIAISTISLFSSIHGALAHQLDQPRTTQALLHMLDIMVSAVLRVDLPADRVAHLPYDTLVADPVGAIRATLTQLGHAWDEGWEQTLTELTSRPRAGERHTYQASDYGLTEEELAERFSAYLEHLHTLAPRQDP